MPAQDHQAFSNHETTPLLKSNSSAKGGRDPADLVISSTLRWGVNVLALLAVFSFSGIVFGWAPLELMLLREGQYRYLCHIEEEEVEEATGSALLPPPPPPDAAESTVEEAPSMIYTASADHAPLCGQQTNALAAMFTVGQFCLNFFSLFGGIALDSLPKSTLLSGCAACQIAGLCLMAWSDTRTTDTTTTTTTDSSSNMDYFYLAYALLAIGGCVTMLSAFPASFLLKQYQAGLLALISCLFDASSIVFAGFQALQNRFGWSRTNLFLVYAVWALLVYTALILCWTLLERQHWEKILMEEDAAAEEEEQVAKTTTNTGDVEGSNHNFIRDSGDDASSSASHLLLANQKRVQSMGILDQFQTYDFAFVMVFTVTHMLQCNYYIMTVDSFLLSLGDAAAYYAGVFSWTLPLGIVFVPFIERTVTYLGVVWTLHTTNVLGLVFGVLLWVPMLSVQSANFLLLTGFRAYFYATINTVIAVTFGVQTMGRIIGCVFTSAAILGLVQYPMAVASEVRFDGDYLPMNILLLGVAWIPVAATFSYGRYLTKTMT